MRRPLTRSGVHIAAGTLLQSQATEAPLSKKKWYSYFIVTDEGDAALGNVSSPEARRVTDVAPAEPEMTFTPPAGSGVDIADVYASAKIQTPAHGYTVLKVAEMLGSEHLQALPPDVKRKSIMVALDAAGVRVDEIVQDAVRRDQALDAYERVLERHVEQRRSETASANQTLKDEIERQLAELRARIDANTKALDEEERDLVAWRAAKRREEDVISAAVGYFVSENPITATTSPAPGNDKGDADVR